MTYRRSDHKVTLKSLEITPESRISVLGQRGEVMSNRPKDLIPETTMKLTDNGLEVEFWVSLRIYNKQAWPNPPVLKITKCRPDADYLEALNQDEAETMTEEIPEDPEE
jgi:hypothetical protein